MRAGGGEGAACDGVPDDLGAVEAGEFGGADGAPQRVGVAQDFAGVRAGRGFADGAGVPGSGFGVALIVPDGEQGSEMVGVRQGMFAGFGRCQLCAVAANNWCEDRDRVVLAGGDGQAGSFALDGQAALAG